MSNMEEFENIVIEKREEIFKQKKFNKYITILNNMGIPEKFDYKDCVPKVFFDLKYDKIKRFELEPYSLLYKDVLKYAKDKDFNRNEEIIAIVHPFYPIIRHANFLIQFPEYYSKYLEYEEKILKILNNKNNNIILFESPDNFARFTYKFYDIGSVKKVIFTEHSTGIALDVNCLETVKKHQKIKIAGCYGDNCLTDVEKQLSNTKTERLKDLILERAIKI